jgi:predicted amidohydrolase YtcJ
MARLGVTVEAQPWDVATAMPALARAADEEFLATTFPFRSLRDAGVRVLFSSDWRISPHRVDHLDVDPLAGMFAAVTRRSVLGGPVWRPEQAVSIAEAFAAYAGGAEAVIRPGMAADLVALSRDVVAEGPDSLPEARVVLTIASGRVVYSA